MNCFIFFNVGTSEILSNLFFRKQTSENFLGQIFQKKFNLSHLNL